MRTTLLALMVILMVQADLTAQKRKKNSTPAATPAADRWAGYQQRQQITENSWVKNIPFRNVGPTIMSGRVVDLEVDPTDPTHFYVAYASGGLWKRPMRALHLLPSLTMKS